MAATRSTKIAQRRRAKDAQAKALVDRLTERTAQRKPVSLPRLERQQQRPDKAWLQARLLEREQTQKALAEWMGIDPGALSLLIHGRRKIKPAEIPLMAEFLGVSGPELLARLGVNLPKIGATVVAIAGTIDGHDQVALGKPSGRVDAGDLARDNVVALRFATAGTSRDPLDGWLAFVELRPDVRDDMLGRLALVETSEGHAYLRQLRRGYEPGLWNLVSLHGDTLHGVRVQRASPLLAMRAA